MGENTRRLTVQTNWIRFMYICTNMNRIPWRCFIQFITVFDTSFKMIISIDYNIIPCIVPLVLSICIYDYPKMQTWQVSLPYNRLGWDSLHFQFYVIFNKCSLRFTAICQITYVIKCKVCACHSTGSVKLYGDIDKLVNYLFHYFVCKYNLGLVYEHIFYYFINVAVLFMKVFSSFRKITMEILYFLEL